MDLSQEALQIPYEAEQLVIKKIRKVAGMELKIVCSTWIKDADNKIIEVLREADKWLSVEELSARTGLSEHRVKGTLRLLRQQREMYDSRKRFLKMVEEDFK